MKYSLNEEIEKKRKEKKNVVQDEICVSEKRNVS